ncbi:hypoxanthine-xanthine-guanine phosphoribosyl transferase hxgprt, partial [Cystoisospora suis]
MASKELEKYGTGEGRVEPMFIADDFFFKAEDFLVPAHYKPYIDKIIIPHGLMLDKVEKLAHDIRKCYKDQELHLLCILKGSRGFFNLLLKYLSDMQKYSDTASTTAPYMEHYVRLKSYVNDTSTGQLKVIGDDLSVLRGKHVLVVEDIVDTGYTLTEFGAMLKAVGPKSLRVASLLEKRTTRSNGFKADFVGFSV